MHRLLQQQNQQEQQQQQHINSSQYVVTTIKNRRYTNDNKNKPKTTSMLQDDNLNINQLSRLNVGNNNGDNGDNNGCDRNQNDINSFMVVQSQENSVNLNRKINIVIAILIVMVISILVIHKVLLIGELKIDRNSIVLSKQQKIQNKQQNKYKTYIQQTNVQLTRVIQKNTINQNQNIAQQIEDKMIEDQKQDKQIIKKPNKIPDKNINPKKIVLEDFITQKPYIQASPQIRAIFDKMIKRDPTKKAKPNNIFHPTQKAYFAYNLYIQPNNQQYLKAQYYYFDNKYNISSYGEKQLPLCIVAPGRNIAQDSQYQKFIQSIAQQNYSNYKIVYIDDVSIDNSVEQLQKFIDNDLDANKIKNKITIVQNKQRVYALANRNNGIRNYCQQNDIVLDVDSDDVFIGRQAFQFVNAIYHNQSVWQSNSVFIYIDKNKKEVTVGPTDGIPDKLLKDNSYRGSMIWKTSQLRTFKAKLFNKIDENDFKDQDGKYYKWASDQFTQQALVELSGWEHYRHCYQIVYFYNWNFDRTTIYKRRYYRDIAWTSRPYKPLQSLDVPAQKVEEYKISDRMKKQQEKDIIEGRKQAQKHGRQVPF